MLFKLKGHQRVISSLMQHLDNIRPPRERFGWLNLGIAPLKCPSGVIVCLIGLLLVMYIW